MVRIVCRRTMSIPLTLLIALGVILVGLVSIRESLRSSLKVIALPSGKEVRQWKYRDVKVAFSADNKLLATVEQNQNLFTRSSGIIKLWHLPSGELYTQLEEEVCWPATLAFSPDGKLLAIAEKDQSKIKIISVTNDKLLASLKASTNDLRCLAFSPNGDLLASGGLSTATRSFDGSAELWDTRKWRHVRSFKNLDIVSFSLAFSHDGRLLAACGHGHLYLWRIQDGTQMLSRNLGNTVAFLPSNKAITATRVSNRIQISALLDDELISDLDVSDLMSSAFFVFSPDGRLMVAMDRFTTKIWQLPQGRLIYKAKGGKSVTLSSRNRYVALIHAVTPRL